MDQITQLIHDINTTPDSRRLIVSAWNVGEIKNAPGMLSAFFTTRVFEEGGDFSINVQTAKLAPFENFVGIKMPKTKGGWYKTDKT